MTYHPSRARRALHWAMGAIAPRRASLSRHLHRLDNDTTYRDDWQLAMRSRGYRAAEDGNSTTPWRTSRATSADAEILGHLHALRARSREAARDDAVACGIVRSYRDGIVGTGIEDRASTGNDDWNVAIDEVWGELRDDLFPAERCGWVGAQRIMATRRVEDGESFVTRAFLGDSPVFFELIEADRVLTPLGARAMLTDPEGQIREGVERDRHGRILKYWVSKFHPGDTPLVNVIFGGKVPATGRIAVEDFNAVPAANLRHLRLQHRPGQSRGVPILHAVLQDLRDLDYLVAAAIKRLSVSASFAMFIESPENFWSDAVNATRAKYGFKLDMDLQPNMIMSLYPGEKVSTVAPNFPIPDVETMSRVVARRIGCSIGLGEQVVLCSFVGSTYSSGRLDRLEAEASWSVPQGEQIDVMRWIRRETLEDAQLRGDKRLAEIPTALLGLARWIPQKKGWVDPKKDAEAAEILLRIGALTLRDVAAELNRDWRDLARQRAIEEAFTNQVREELGLPALPPPALTEAPSAPSAPPEEGEDSGEDADRSMLELVANRVNGAYS